MSQSGSNRGDSASSKIKALSKILISIQAAIRACVEHWSERQEEEGVAEKGE